MNSSVCVRVIAGAASVLATAALGAMIGGAAGEAAIPQWTSQSVRVRFGDLDLSRPEGVDALKRRIRQAALRVCDQTDTKDLHSMARFDRCMNEASSQALAEVGLAEK